MLPHLVNSSKASVSCPFVFLSHLIYIRNDSPGGSTCLLDPPCWTNKSCLSNCSMRCIFKVTHQGAAPASGRPNVLAWGMKADTDLFCCVFYGVNALPCPHGQMPEYFCAFSLKTPTYSPTLRFPGDWPPNIYLWRWVSVAVLCDSDSYACNIKIGVIFLWSYNKQADRQTDRQNDRQDQSLYCTG